MLPFSMIEIQEIFLQYGPKVLFNNISSVIGTRDRIGLVGSNGAGKSTLIKLLLGETEADKGNIVQPSYVSLGYLPQDGIEVSGRTLYEEVESAFEDVLSLQKKIDEADAQMLEMDTSSEEYYELIDMIGEWEHKLEEHEPDKMKSNIEKMLLGLGFEMSDLNRDTGEFSGGWQMRIALAKLLLKEPSLLLLDEPTTGLDPKSRRDVQTFLEELREERGTTILLTTHDMAEAERLCHRIGFLSKGHLILEGTANEITEASNTANLEEAFISMAGESLENEPELVVT